MTNYDELVQRLRVWSLDERRGDGMLLVRTSDAIVQLQARVAELTDELQIECAARQTALAERDALRERAVELERQRNSLQESLERENKMVIKFGKRYERAEVDLVAAQKECDDALAAVDSNWVTHQQIVVLQQDLAAARAESDLAHWLLRNARKYMNPMHEALCAAIDNVLQKKQAALAGKDAP